MARVHANRTCVCCGIRRPQPEMKLVEGYREVAKGKASFGPMTIAGAVLGSKAASRSLERAIFNAGERKIYRKIQVWSCPTCVKQVKAELRMPINWLTVGVFIVGAIVAIALLGVI